MTVEKVHWDNILKKKAKAEALAKNGCRNRKKMPVSKARGKELLGRPLVIILLGPHHLKLRFQPRRDLLR